MTATTDPRAKGLVDKTYLVVIKKIVLINGYSLHVLYLL